MIADAGLSKREKAKALEGMEQDARLLDIASAEGMCGGEPSNLAEVLRAKDVLEDRIRELARGKIAAGRGGDRALVPAG